MNQEQIFGMMLLIFGCGVGVGFVAGLIVSMSFKEE